MENDKVKRKTELTADELGKRLYRFINHKKLKKAKLLIADPKCNVNWTSETVTEWTSLIKASFHGYPDFVKVLLKRQDLSVNYQSWCCDSALISGTVMGKISCVGLLVNDLRTKINLLDEEGRSALWWAYSNSFPPIMKLLISHGANVNGIAASVVKYNKVHVFYPPSTEATLIMKNWKSYLPEFIRFAKTNKYYPSEFKQWAFNFILCCTKSKAFCKDIIYLLLEYIARAWKKI